MIFFFIEKKNSKVIYLFIPDYLKLQQTNRFFCDICVGKSYKYKGDLIRHKRFECQKLPQFLCPVCGKYFWHKFNLKIHTKRIHP